MGLRLLGLVFVVALQTACVSSPYLYGTGDEYHSDEMYPPMEEQFLYGEPSKFLDASDWIWPGSWLAKLLLWDKKIDSHEISEDTIQKLQDYIEANKLENVQVLVNSYSPGNQWSRLFKNKSVGAGWRYTLGILSVAYYSALPGRFFGGDAYNPYTNTIYLYSDIDAVALHEGGHAKDFTRRKHKGMHAAIYAIPLAPLYYEAVASNDTVSYLNENGDADSLKRAYRKLHPAYGTYIGGGFGTILGLPYAAAAAVIPGHITGNISAARVPDDLGCDQEDAC